MTLHDGEFEASTLSDDVKEIQFDDIVTVPADVPIDKVKNALKKARIACNTARSMYPEMFEGRSKGVYERYRQSCESSHHTKTSRAFTLYVSRV